MERKKMILVLVICLCLMLALFIIKEFRHQRGVAYRVVDHITDQVQTYYSPETQEETRITKYLRTFERALRQEDLETLLLMTDERFLDYRFENDQEAFFEFMKPFMGENTSVALQEYTEKKSQYICDIIIYASSGSRIMRVAITKNGEKLSKMIFDNVEAFDSYHLECVNASLDLKMTIIFVKTVEKGVEFVLEVENIGTKEFQADFQEAVLLDTKGQKFNANVEGLSISLKGEEKMRQKIQFTNSGIFLRPKEKLEISLSPQKEGAEADLFQFDIKNVVI